MATKKKPTSPKRGSVKKAAKKLTGAVVPAIKPLSSFKNWRINRSKTTDIISFGCGEVRVNKKDLITIGKNPEVLGALKRVIQANKSATSWNKLTIDELLRIKPETFLRIAGN